METIRDIKETYYSNEVSEIGILQCEGLLMPHKIIFQDARNQSKFNPHTTITPWFFEYTAESITNGTLGSFPM